MALTKPLLERKEITFEDYLLLPEIKKRYDIVDGEMIMSPAPTPVHQQILAELYDHVKPFVRRRKLGVVLFAPLDIVIQRRPKLRTRQPDLVFFSVQRYGRRLRERFGSAPIEFAPDLAVDGELQASTALVEEMLNGTYPFNRLQREANVLIFPNLEAGNIGFKLVQKLANAEVIGPILVGMRKPAFVLQRGDEVKDVVNLAALAVVEAQKPDV